MATEFYFGGKKVKLPGVYTNIKSGIKNQPLVSDYGKVLLIDTGTGAGFAGGAGVNGEISQGVDSLYGMSALTDFRGMVKGGKLWKVAEPLFKPKGAELGISNLYFIKAATTTSALMTFTATGGGSNGGELNIYCVDEGTCSNGSVESDNLITGYAYTVEAAANDPGKWVLKIYTGTYKGEHTDGYAFDEVAKANVVPELVVQSPAFDNMQTLIDWAMEDFDFNTLFRINDGSGANDPNYGDGIGVEALGLSVVNGTGVIDSDDIAAITGYQVAAGGTEVYGTDDLADVLTVVKDLDYSFILSDISGTTDYSGAKIGAIVSHVQTEAKYEKVVFYGAGDGLSQFTASQTVAEYFDDDQVVVVHGGIKKASQLVGTGFRTWGSIYHTAYLLGRLAGLAPQVPLTFKGINVDGLVHNLTDKDKEKALDTGLLVTYFDVDFNDFVCLKGINSIQNNKFLVNADASSYSIQLRRIVAQINKDLAINAKIQLLGQPQGVNRNTLSANAVKEWTRGFLQSKVATTYQDNLILSFANITVTRNQDAYFVEYGIIPNGEIDKLFFTGTILE